VVNDAAAAADALHAIHDRPKDFMPLGPRAAREMARLSSDLHAGRRIRELGRQLVHGVVDPHTLAMTAAIAATMRDG
jgi:hypothetical protein